MTRATGRSGRVIAWLVVWLLAAEAVLAVGQPFRRQMPQMFRPQPGSNAQGVPPGALPQYDFTRGWSPYPMQPRQGYGDSTRSRQNSAPPYLEASLSHSRAYVQQNLILTVDTVSGANLSTIEVQLPKTNGVVFRQLGDTQAETRNRSGRREIINRLHYLATPLRAGELELQGLNVSGKFTDGRSFEARGAPLVLEVLPPEPGIVPWLPLDDLELNARMLNDDAIEQGEPLTLIIEQRAIGASGSQLRSPEQQLQSSAYRLYREDSQVQGHIGRDGRLVGSRVDTFTLVPPKDRAMKIPAVRVTWWNVPRQRKETTIIPSRILNSNAGFARDTSNDLRRGPFFTGSAWAFWLPVVLVAFFMGLYWTWLWAKGRAYGERFRATVREGLAPLRRRLLWLYHLFSPRRHLHVARRWFADTLPRSYRLWFCVRAADEETDPADYSQVLRFLVQRRLGVSAQVPMTRLGEVIIALHPSARPERIRELMGELDAAVFGRAPIDDFGHWKRRFKHEIRPRLVHTLFRSRGDDRRQRLPELNPG